MSDQDIKALWHRFDEKQTREAPSGLSLNVNVGSIMGTIASVIVLVNGCSMKPITSIHQIDPILNLGFGASILVLSEIAHNTNRKRRDQRWHLASPVASAGEQNR